MHTSSLKDWQHDHVFGQDEIKSGENRTLIVIIITAVMMAVEIASGILSGSMALLADGLHMGSHAAALGITVIAYIYARKRAQDHRYSFGTGKVNSLAGFASALLLAIFAIIMVWESVNRFIHPVEIIFEQAIMVSIIGLIVNGVCALILGNDTQHVHDNGEKHRSHFHHREDHNLRGAFLHVLSDAITSILAIVALFAGMYLGFNWMDPFMGIIGAILVARWSWGLIRDTSNVLLDKQGPSEVRSRVKDAIEAKVDNRIADLHLWSIGPGIYSASISIVTTHPGSPESYKQLIPKDIGLVHPIIEIHKCMG